MPRGGGGTERGAAHLAARRELASPRALARLCGGAAPTADQRAAAKEWLGLLGAGRLGGEGGGGGGQFQEIVLGRLLGYGKGDIARGRDGEFLYAPGGRAVACFDAAVGPATDLFAPQYGGGKGWRRAPIWRMWDLVERHGAEYGVCSNHRHFALISRRLGRALRCTFDFGAIGEDPRRLGEFVGVFSRGGMDGGLAGRAHDETAREERDLAEEFYDLYGRTRLMLAREFEASGDDRGGAVARAQEFLNRLVFVLFAEDCGLSGKKDMLMDGVIEVLGGSVTRSTKRVWAYIAGELFGFYRDGCRDPGMQAFNGGLFDGQMGGRAHFPDRRSGGFFGDLGAGAGRRPRELGEKAGAAVGAHGDVNPVIKNLLALASYDFQGLAGAGILGHAFESSVSDLDEMLGGREPGRKAGGARYAPRHAARYACRRAIIPQLSRSGKASDPQELVAEYAGDLDELDGRLDGIRILDPACGSGAFLAEAAYTLLDIHDEMTRHREAAARGGGAAAAAAVDRGTLNPSIYDARVRRIIAECLYGMDINPQSVGIARLSLFLLAASAGESLPDLSSHIVAADGMAPAGGADWEDMFGGVFSGGNPGFSAIVGSPPHAGQEGTRGPKAGMQLRRRPRSAPPDVPDGFEVPRSGNPISHFYLHSLARLRRGGRLGFISGDGWMRAGRGEALQRALLDNASIDVVAVADFKAPGDADASTAVVVAERGRPRPGHEVSLATARAPADLAGAAPPGALAVRQSEMRPGNWSALLAGAPAAAPFKAAPLRAAPFKAVPMSAAGAVRLGAKTGHRPFFVLSAGEAERQGVPRRYLRPRVTGRSGALLEDGDASEFLLDVRDEKGTLGRTADGRAVLEYIRRGEATEAETSLGGRRATVRLPDLPTVSSRRPWYSLGLAGAPPPIFLSRLAGGRMRVHENGGTYRSTDTHVSYEPRRAGHARALAAYLASAWFALHMERSANPTGGGAPGIEVGDFAAAPVPDLDALPGDAARRLEDAWAAYCEDADLGRLDRAVMSALGFDDGQIAAVLEELGRLARRRAGRRRGP